MRKESSVTTIVSAVDLSICALDPSESFALLKPHEKKAAFHLYRAVCEAQKISFLQTSPESSGILLLFQEIFSSPNETGSPGEILLELQKNCYAKGLGDAFSKFLLYVARFYYNFGNYDQVNGTKIVPELARSDFLDVVHLTRAFTERRGAKISRLLEACMDDIYNNDVEVGAGVDGMVGEEEQYFNTPIASYPFYDNGSITSKSTSSIPRIQYDVALDIDAFLEANDISPLNTRLMWTSATSVSSTSDASGAPRGSIMAATTGTTGTTTIAAERRFFNSRNGKSRKSSISINSPSSRRPSNALSSTDNRSGSITSPMSAAAAAAAAAAVAVAAAAVASTSTITSNVSNKNTIQLQPSGIYQVYVASCGSKKKSMEWSNVPNEKDRLQVFTGDYQFILQKVRQHLEQALEVMDKNLPVIDLLIEFFNTGNVQLFQQAKYKWWYQDNTESRLLKSFIGFFVNINDPFHDLLTQRGRLESFVGIQNSFYQNKIQEILSKHLDQIVHFVPGFVQQQQVSTNTNPTMKLLNDYMVVKAHCMDLLFLGRKGQVLMDMDTFHIEEEEEEKEKDNKSIGSICFYFPNMVRMQHTGMSSMERRELLWGLYPSSRQDLKDLITLHYEQIHFLQFVLEKIIAKKTAYKFYQNLYEYPTDRIVVSIEKRTIIQVRHILVGLLLSFEPSIQKMICIQPPSSQTKTECLQKVEEEIALGYWLETIRQGLLALQQYTPLNHTWSNPSIHARYIASRIILQGFDTCPQASYEYECEYEYGHDMEEEEEEDDDDTEELHKEDEDDTEMDGWSEVIGKSGQQKDKPKEKDDEEEDDDDDDDDEEEEEENDCFPHVRKQQSERNGKTPKTTRFPYDDDDDDEFASRSRRYGKYIKLKRSNSIVNSNDVSLGYTLQVDEETWREIASIHVRGWIERIDSWLLPVQEEDHPEINHLYRKFGRLDEKFALFRKALLKISSAYRKKCPPSTIGGGKTAPSGSRLSVATIQSGNNAGDPGGLAGIKKIGEENILWIPARLTLEKSSDMDSLMEQECPTNVQLQVFKSNLLQAVEAAILSVGIIQEEDEEEELSLGQFIEV